MCISGVLWHVYMYFLLTVQLVVYLNLLQISYFYEQYHIKTEKKIFFIDQQEAAEKHFDIQTTDQPL